MAETQYIYTISQDFQNGRVNLETLALEIEGSSITTALSRLRVTGNACHVIFADALTAGEKTTLDGDAMPPSVGSLIGDHLGDASLEEQDRVGWVNGIVDRDLTAPPGSPNEDDYYIVGNSATGAWAGHDGCLTSWNGVAWEFCNPRDGYAVWVADEQIVLVCVSGVWKDVTDQLRAVTGSENGLMLAADKTKLDAVESGATGDQTAGEIEAIVNHDNLVGYDVAQHRTINDAGTSTNDLWSASKISSELAAATSNLDLKDSVETVADTNITLSGEQTLNGVTTSTSRVGVVGQTTASENGIYVTAAGAWARSTDADADAEVTQGMTFFVSDGTLKGSQYILQTADPITVGTTALTFVTVPRIELGTTAGTAAEGNDSRIPTQDENDALAGTGAPSAANVFVTNDDARLSDSRAPTGSAGGDLTGTYPNPTVADGAVSNAKAADMATSTIKGRATAGTGDPEDLTATQVRTILNVEDGADVTDATNVGAAGAVMDSDISESEGFLRKTGVGAYEALKSNLGATVDPGATDDSAAGYAVGSRWINVTLDKEFVCLDATATAAVWTETTVVGAGDVTGPASSSDNAVVRFDGTGGKTVQNSGVLISDTDDLSGIGNITLTGTVDGRDVAADGTKLDGIEASADVTDTANVDAAGAVMESDFNAQTVLVAVSDNTPTAVIVNASSFVGRKATGDVGVMTAAEARAVLNVEDGATADQTAGEIEAIVNHDNLIGFVADEHVSFLAGTAAARPAAAVSGRYYFATDTKVLSRDTGSAWENVIADPASHTHAAADVTSGTFADARVAQSNVTQHEGAIDHDALTNFVANEHIDWTADQGATNVHVNNVQDASTTAKGVVELATDGENAAGVVVQGNDARLSDSRAPSGSAGGDLTGTYPNPTVASDAVTNAKLANMATSTIKGRVTAATGDPEDLTAAQARTILNVEDGADVTDATNVAAAGAVMDSDISESEGFLRKSGAGAYEACKSNLGATTAPGAADDTSAGYKVGSNWINTTTNKAFVCVDNTASAAVWKDITHTGSGLANWQGTWVSQNYILDDAVEYQGSSYICTTNTISSEVPTNTTYWDLIAAKGDAGTGDVDGPVSATDNAVVRFDSTTGKLLQNSGVLISDTDDLSGIGNITLTGTVDGRDVATDGTKLDGIEASADVTDATNVDAAGAVMESDFNAQTVLVAVSDNTPTAVVVNASSFVGRKATGDAGAMTAAEARTVLNVEDGADVTDATNVAAAGAVMDSDISESEGLLRKTGAGAYEAIKTNLGASTAPGATDDSAAGYAVGSVWIDTTADKAYLCLDVTATAAVWTETTNAANASATLEYASATTNTSTTSTTAVLVNSMTLSPPAGDYLVMFSSSGELSDNNASGHISIYVNGALIADSERHATGHQHGSNNPVRQIFQTISKITVGAGETVEARYRTTAGTFSLEERSLSLLKV